MSDDTTVTADNWTSGQAAPPEEAVAAPDGPALPFRFEGSGGEYFRIWIVNLCLSILTLGIYSAWAKVRTKRYFYGNTSLDGASFEYTAEPLKILKGRVIATVVLGAYFLLGQFFPIASLPLLIAYVALFPWLMMKSLAFNAHHSVHRGLRFRFAQEFGRMFLVYGLLPWLIPLTFGLYFPFWKRRVAELYSSQHSYGQSAFSFDAGRAAYMKIYAVGLLIVVFCGLVAVGGFTQSTALLGAIFEILPFELDPQAAENGDPWQQLIFQLLGFAAIAIGYLFLLPAYAWVRARSDNLRWNSTRLGEHRFYCDQSMFALLGIYLLNIVSILCTAGFAIPWAKIRLARYRAEHLSFIPAGSVDELLAGVEEEVSATSDAFDDLADFDTGL